MEARSVISRISSRQTRASSRKVLGVSTAYPAGRYRQAIINFMQDYYTICRGGDKITNL
jgi:hypothetical protein